MKDSVTKEELDLWQESDRSGREYERLVCRVMRGLFKKALVSERRNEVLCGASGAGYEIDLLMDLSFRGKKCFVAVECKDYARSVGKEKVAAFCSVLRDLNAVKRDRRDKPDLILSDPVRGWSAGIWDWKAVRLPDGAMF